MRGDARPRRGVSSDVRTLLTRHTRPGLRVAIVTLVATATAIACTEPLNTNCTDIGILPVAVYVRDAASDTGIASGATLVLASAGFVDSANFEDGFPHLNDFALAVYSSVERPGVYSATVRREGYAPWDTAGVTVGADQCHVHPKVLIARLQPLP